MEYPKISLKAARINAGLTQTEASKALNISPDTLRNYETGRTVPDWDKVNQMEELYGISINYLKFTHDSD